MSGRQGAAIGDPEQAQLGRIDHRRHPPLGHGGPRAEELREPGDRRPEVHRRPPEIESVIWVVPSLRLTCQGSEAGCVANWARLSRTCWYCNSGRVAPLVDRPSGGADRSCSRLRRPRPRMKETRTSRINVSGGDDRTVYTDFIGGGRLDCENTAMSISAIASTPPVGWTQPVGRTPRKRGSPAAEAARVAGPRRTRSPTPRGGGNAAKPVSGVDASHRVFLDQCRADAT